MAATPTALQSNFAVLRHAPAPSKMVPAAVARAADKAAAQGIVVDVSQTRRVASPGGGMVDVTPGSNGVCLYDESEQVGTCSSSADALAGRLSVELVKPGDGLVVPTDTPRVRIGLLPDDANSTSALSNAGAISSRANGDGLYRLSSLGVIREAIMHRAGKPPLSLASAKKAGWRAPVRARAAQICNTSNCYWDGVPSGHPSGWTFYPNVAEVGVWQGIKTIDLNPSPTTPGQLCAAAQNTDGSLAGGWFCGTAGPSGYSWHDYNGAYTRRGVACAGSTTPVMSGWVREFYS